MGFGASYNPTIEVLEASVQSLRTDLAFGVFGGVGFGVLLAVSRWCRYDAEATAKL